MLIFQSQSLRLIKIRHCKHLAKSVWLSVFFKLSGPDLSCQPQMENDRAHGSRTAKQFKRGAKRQAVWQIDRQASWIQEIGVSKSVMSCFLIFENSCFNLGYQEIPKNILRHPILFFFNLSLFSSLLAVIAFYAIFRRK